MSSPGVAVLCWREIHAGALTPDPRGTPGSAIKLGPVSTPLDLAGIKACLAELRAELAKYATENPAVAQKLDNLEGGVEHCGA